MQVSISISQDVKHEWSQLCHRRFMNILEERWEIGRFKGGWQLSQRMRVNGLYRRYNHNLEIRIGIGKWENRKTIKIETAAIKKSSPIHKIVDIITPLFCCKPKWEHLH